MVIAAAWLPTGETAELVALLVAGLVGLLGVGLLLAIALAVVLVLWDRGKGPER